MHNSWESTSCSVIRHNSTHKVVVPEDVFMQFAYSCHRFASQKFVAEVWIWSSAHWSGWIYLGEDITSLKQALPKGSLGMYLGGHIQPPVHAVKIGGGDVWLEHQRTERSECPFLYGHEVIQLYCCQTSNVPELATRTALYAFRRPYFCVQAALKVLMLQAPLFHL